MPRRRVNKFGTLIESVFAGILGSLILYLVFTITTNAALKFVVFIAFILIGVLVGYSVWRFLEKWI